MATSDSLIQVKNLKKHYHRGAIKALDGVTADINKGDVMVVIGPSGSGKSTFLRSLNLLEEPTDGEIIFNGVDITKKKYKDASGKTVKLDIDGLRQKMGMVFQHFNLFPHMTILDNMTLAPMKVKGVSKEDAEKKALELLEIVGLADRAKAYPAQLSGGQKQRVAIARALVNEPKVLLLDEPLGALDAKIRKQMQVELKKIQQEVGITFIYVTHDQEEALSMSDTVVVMNNGEIQQIGSPTDIYNEPENRFVSGFIGESNIIEGTMIKDFLVEFDGFQFECVDKGFEDNEEIEVVLRPEDLDIVDPGQAKIRGIVRNITFKGVHYEILIETELRTYMVHTTDYAEVGREVGLKFGPEDIHVMCKMGSY